MQAFVKGRSTQARSDEARVIDAAESLKVPVPAVEDYEHPRRHRQSQDKEVVPVTRRQRSSRGGNSTHGTQHDENVESNANTVRVQGNSGPSASPHAHAIQLSPDDEEHFNDMNELDLGFDMISGSQAEMLKRQKLVEMHPRRLIDKYIEGDSYPDTTTSGHLSDGEFEHGYNESRLPPSSQMAASAPRTWSEHDISSTQPFFRRHETAVPDDAPTFSVPLLRRGQTAKQSSQLSSKALLYQQARPPQPSEESSQGRFLSPARTARFMTQPPLDLQANASQVPINPQQEWNHSDYAQDELSQLQSKEMNDNLVQPQPISLDYDLDKLKEMQYEQLKAEVFDYDPRAEQQDVPDVEALSANLNSLRSLAPQQWSDFFRSLHIQQWEESGEWFVDQFSAILTSLKDVRRQRRETTMAFEVEVENRHEAVIKKHTIIDDTMSAMRTHGAQVLSTPRTTKAAAQA